MPWAASSFGACATAIGSALMLALGAAWAQAGSSASPPLPQTSASDGRAPGSDLKPARDAVDGGGGARLFQPSGNPDRDFAVMMRAHHQEGVDMANLEIAHGKSVKLKAIARRIVKDQQREILELDRWTARHDLKLSAYATDGIPD